MKVENMFRFVWFIHQVLVADIFQTSLLSQLKNKHRKGSGFTGWRIAKLGVLRNLHF